MNFNINYKNVFFALLAAILIAIPTAAVLSKHKEAQIERTEKQRLQVDLEQREQELNQQINQKLKAKKQLENKSEENQTLKQKNQRLQEKLQSKREREAEEARLAAQRERERQQEREEAQAAVASDTAVGNGENIVKCETFRSKLSQYDWNVDTALRVIDAESYGGVDGLCDTQADNWNDNHGQCMGSFGLFQISCHDGQVYDVDQNFAVAHRKYSSGGWYGHWGVCISGIVRC